MSSLWYLYRSDQQFGPYSWKELAAHAGSGFVDPEDMVWREGTARCTRASQVEGLMAKTAGGTHKEAEADRSLPTDAHPAPGKERNRRRLFLGLTLALLILLAGVATIWAGNRETLGTGNHLPLNAVITALEGPVTVRRSGQALAVPAELNLALNAGDLVSTGPAGFAELMFDDGSLSRVDENSRVEIMRLYREGPGGPDVTMLGSDGGGVWNNVKDLTLRNSRFEINTPLTVAGVRGTLFMVKVESDGETLVRVYEGYVETGPTAGNGTILSGAFYQARYRPGAPLPLEPEPLEFDDIGDFELLNLMKDSLDSLVALLELAAELGERDFLLRVLALMDDDRAKENLGENWYYVRALLEYLLRTGSKPGPDWEPWFDPGLPGDTVVEPAPVPAPTKEPAPEPRPDPAPDDTGTTQVTEIPEVRIQPQPEPQPRPAPDPGPQQPILRFEPLPDPAPDPAPGPAPGPTPDPEPDPGPVQTPDPGADFDFPFLF